MAEARQHADAGRFDLVIELLEAIPAVKHTYDAHHLLAMAYSKTDRPHAARHSFQSAIRLRPTSAEDHYLLGNLYFTQRKFALAVESYAEAERFGHDAPEMHYRMATCYYELGNYVGRIETRTVIGGKAGQAMDGVYLLDAVPDRPGRFRVAPKASAIYHLRRALDSGLDTAEIHLLHGDIWLASRHYARAVEIYRAIEHKVPPAEEAGFYRRFAEACLGVDDLEGYLGRLERAVALGGPAEKVVLPEAYRKVADRYNAAGDLANYIRYLELAAKEAPESAELRYRLGNAYYEAGREQDASRSWRITLELDPGHPDRQRLLEHIRDIGSR
jgi:tetratricopeptide (TPR) repeat protein